MIFRIIRHPMIIMMKLSEGFSRPGYAAAPVVGMIVRFWALIAAVKELPIRLA